MPQKPKLHGSKRPLGPFGAWNVHNCSATCGASRTATAQAPGGFIIKAPWPEISHLLLAALSQANTLVGRDGTIFLNHAKTSFTASELTVMLPSPSTSCAPCPANTALTQLTESLQVLSGMPNGYPALAHFSAAAKNPSQVHASASASSGGAPAGYIRVTSSPTNCLKWSMRAHGISPVVWTPVGTAIQWPFCLPIYSEPSSNLPCSLISKVTSSLTGSRLSAWAATYQSDICRMSWPDLACASAVAVSASLSPWLVMKSMGRSSFSRSAHSRHSLASGSLAPGTQWSQKPQDSFPAA